MLYALTLGLLMAASPYTWSKQAARDPGKMDQELQKIERAFRQIADEGPWTVTRLTFTEDLYSVTPYATPIGFASTTFDGFASAQGGATLMGYGSVYDVSFRNRSGSVVAGILAGTTTFSIPGTLSVTGTIAFTNTTDSTSATTGAVTVAGGVGVAKQIWAGTGITNTNGNISAKGAGGAFVVHRRDTDAQAWALFSSAGELSVFNVPTAVTRLTIQATGAAAFANSLQSVGFTSTQGNISAAGSSGAFVVVNRTSAANAWAIYSAAGNYHLFSTVAAADRWVMDTTGAVTMTAALSGVTNITGNASSMTILAGTGASRTLTLQTTTAGSVATTALTLSATQTATFANTVTVTTGGLTVSAGTTSLQATTLNAALTYGGVTLANAVTGTGNMVLSASPTFTGTVVMPAATYSGLVTFNGGATVASGQTLTLTGATVSGSPTWSSDQAITLSTASQPNVTTMANLTTIGTLIAGAVPASLVTAGTFGAGDYVFPSDLTVTDTFVLGTNATVASTAKMVSVGADAFSDWYRYADHPLLRLFRINGNAGAPTTAVSGNILGEVAFGGYDGTTYANKGAQVYAKAVETWSNTAHGTRLVFSSVPATTTTLTESWQLTDAGVFGPVADNTYNFAAQGTRVKNGYAFAWLAGTTAVASTASHFVLSAAAGNVRDITWQTAGVDRWRARANATAESGSDVGSDWQLVSRTDAGASKTVVLQFTRSSGLATFGGNIVYASDNAFDFGASGATRPRTGYFGTSVVAPILDSGAATDLLLKRNGTTQLTIGSGTLTTNARILVTGSATVQSGITIGGNWTATSAAVYGLHITPTLIAAANNDTIVSHRVAGVFTPGAFTGLTYKAIEITAKSVATYTSPADPIMLDIGVLTGTGATNAYAIKFGAGPSGATNNYLLHATNFNVTSAGTATLPTVAATTRVTSPLLGTTTATDVVFDRNSVIKLTLGNTTDTFANNTITNGNADWVFQRNASTIFTLAATSLTMNLPVLTKAYTVATLPAGTKGMVAHVTDALAPAFLTAVVGGGAAFALVAYDGTNWVAV